MKINKGRPSKNRGYVIYKKYFGRHTALINAKQLALKNIKVYIRKIGKIGVGLKYEVWFINRCTRVTENNDIVRY